MTSHQVTYGDTLISFQLYRIPKPSRKVAIHVHPDGSVQVDAPESAALVEVKKALLKRARWVIKHVESAKAVRVHVRPRQYVSGECYFYLGRRYKLKVVHAKDSAKLVKLYRGCIEVSTQNRSKDTVKSMLDHWYREHARQVFEQRLEELVGRISWLKVAPRWKLLVMTKQWGSCSPKGTLTLNPHLVKAPRQCIDYVILHELCHLREHNHSPRFYALLSRVMPKWELVKSKLDDMAEELLNR